MSWNDRWRPVVNSSSRRSDVARCWLTALAALLLAVPSPLGAEEDQPLDGATRDLDIADGRHVLPDGVFDPGEWDDASALALDGVELLAKGDDRYLYVALRFVEETHTGLDLYLAAGAEARRLFHISSELLEKEFERGSWGAYDRDIGGWTGNPVGFLHQDDRIEIHEPEGFELQIARSLLAAEGLGADTLQLAFRLKRPEKTVPEGAEEAALEDWVILRWPPDGG